MDAEIQAEDKAARAAILLADGVACNQIGQHVQALEIYKRLLHFAPDNLEGLNNRGATLMSLQRYELAITDFTRALALNPVFWEAARNLGTALANVGNLAEALASLDRAIAIKQDYVEAWFDRGIVLAKLGRHDEALSSYDQVIAIDPHNFKAIDSSGIELMKLGRYSDALARHRRALDLKPDMVEAEINAAAALKYLGKLQESLASLDRAVALAPDSFDGLTERGFILWKLNRFEESLECVDRILVRNPDHVRTLNSRSALLWRMRRFDELRHCVERTLVLDPTSQDALSHRINVQVYENDLEGALETLNQQLKVNPNNTDAIAGRAGIFMRMGRLDEALKETAYATRIKPDSAQAHFNASLAHLRKGELRSGFLEYEWRWHLGEELWTSSRYPGPIWMGKESLRGKNILLYAEQGLGDTIQFVRYVPMVAGRGAKVLLSVPRPLMPLLKEFPGVSELLAPGEPLPTYDFHCPLLSLPLAFDTELDSIPTKVPYLAPGAEKLKQWRDRLGSGKKTFRVGIVWAGNPSHGDDHNRSIPLKQFASVLSASQLQFVRLQKERRPEEVEVEKSLSIMDVSAELQDFTDTAAAIAALDLVISVDTSVAHLAGALGRPVWILVPFSPDWRWLDRRTDSPWYPTARLFRQPAIGDWESVLQQVKVELGKQAKGRTSTLK